MVGPGGTGDKMFKGFLKQSTASQIRTTGIFVDQTDGFTPETALTIANTDVKLSKNGAATVNKNSGGATHIVNGQYTLTWNATDTDTVGELAVTIVIAGTARPVAFDYMVLEEAVYDNLFGAAATGPFPNTVLAKPGQATPPDTDTPGGMLASLYKFTVNKNVLTATANQVFSNDSATVDQKSVVSNDGVTLIRGKYTTGP